LFHFLIFLCISSVWSIIKNIMYICFIFSKVCRNKTNPEKSANTDFNQHFCLSFWENSHSVCCSSPLFILLSCLFLFPALFQMSSIATSSWCSQQTLQDQYTDLRHFLSLHSEKQDLFFSQSCTAVCDQCLSLLPTLIMLLLQIMHSFYLYNPQKCCKATLLKCSGTFSSWSLSLQLILIHAQLRLCFLCSQLLLFYTALSLQNSPFNVTVSLTSYFIYPVFLMLRTSLLPHTYTNN